MKRKVKYSDLFTTADFLKYYKGASIEELKASLKRIENSRGISKKNEKRAIKLSIINVIFIKNET